MKISIFLIILAALVGALGQYLYKEGVERSTDALTSYIFNWRIALGVLGYAAVMVCFISAFKKGGTLTVIYPIYATTFIWAAVIAYIAYGTPIKPINVSGMALLISGIYLMAK